MMTATFVLLFETGALSAGVITGNYRGIYSTNKDWGLFAVVVIRDDWGFSVLYNTGTLSEGAITCDDRDVCNT